MNDISLAESDLSTHTSDTSDTSSELRAELGYAIIRELSLDSFSLNFRASRDIVNVIPISTLDSAKAIAEELQKNTNIKEGYNNIYKIVKLIQIN